MQRGVVHWTYKNFYGYRKGADGEPEIIEEHATVIRRIFKDYLKGYSTKRIADELNVDKIPRLKAESIWTISNVQNILENERYCGDVILQKTYTVNHRTKQTKKNNGELPKVNHKGIISREVFRQVGIEKARRTSKRRTSEKTITENEKVLNGYDENLVRQVLGLVQVKSENLLKVSFKDGRECEQELKLKIKSRNKK